MKLGLAILLTLGAFNAFGQVGPSSLDSEYAGKIRILKDFQCGRSVVFEPSGVVSSSADPGPWTKCGYISISHLKFGKKNTLEIEGKRIDVIFHDQNPQLMKASPVTIEVRGVSDEVTARQALENVFIATKASMSDFVPDYWQPFVSDPQQFSKRKEEEEKISPHPCPEQSDEKAPCRVGGDILPPKPKSTPDPDYDPDAKAAHFQGTTILRAVIDRSGRIYKVFITNPLGLGLDEKAIEAVKRWKFNPAVRKSDGTPVAVEITIEVNFHLF